MSNAGGGRPTGGTPAGSSAGAADVEWTIGKLLGWTTNYFAGLPADVVGESPRLDAEVLLASVLSCRRIDLYALFETEVAAADRAKYRELVKQRARGCPVAYLLGSREFYSLSFAVTPAVLIPRPETETLVAEAIRFARPQGRRKKSLLPPDETSAAAPEEPEPASPVKRFLDVGAGSGAVALAILHELPDVRGTAVDCSPEALAVARGNAEALKLADRLSLFASDLFAAVPKDEPFDLVVSNPPYIATGAIAGLSATVRDFEPRLALDGGADGLAVLRRLVADAPAYLRPGGLLLMEIGFDQESAVQKLFADRPDLWTPRPTARDLDRRPRVAGALRR
ncbi:MAG: peptide chain release factor N(5)-glutamine methyltransferase [Planctomycetia bacterium]